MEMIVTIFKSLGVDQTVFIQLVSLIIIFVILKTLLFGKLKEVLDLRDKKTIKLEGSAHAVYKKAEELQEQYKAHIEKTHQDSHLKTQKVKNDLREKESKKLKETEELLAREYETKRSAMVSEINAQRSKSLAEVETLSKNLVEKLTK
jgi:F-type H+-transporting ATPase subunit b